MPALWVKQQAERREEELREKEQRSLPGTRHSRKKVSASESVVEGEAMQRRVEQVVQRNRGARLYRFAPASCAPAPRAGQAGGFRSSALRRQLWRESDPYVVSHEPPRANRAFVVLHRYSRRRQLYSSFAYRRTSRSYTNSWSCVSVMP